MQSAMIDCSALTYLCIYLMPLAMEKLHLALLLYLLT